MNDELLKQLLERIDRLENKVVSMRSLIVKQTNQTLALKCMILSEISMMHPKVAAGLADRYEVLLDQHITEIGRQFQIQEILEEIHHALIQRGRSR